jgi:hypothetical protein
MGICVVFIVIAICGFSSNLQVSNAVHHLSPAADRMINNASFLAQRSLSPSQNMANKVPVNSKVFYDEEAMLEVMNVATSVVKSYELTAVWDTSLIKLTDDIKRLADKYTVFWDTMAETEAIGDSIRDNARSFIAGIILFRLKTLSVNTA